VPLVTGKQAHGTSTDGIEITASPSVVAISLPFSNQNVSINGLS